MNPNKNIQMQEEGSGGIIIDVFPRTKSTIVETAYGTLDKVLHDLYFNGSSSGGGIAPGEDAHVRNIYVDGSILPNGADKVIGDKNNRFKAIYVDEVFMSTNTLYIGDTPILGTNQDTIQIKADPNQSINMMTSGAGVTKVLSESGVEFSTSGMNANVVIQAKGVNSQTNIAATSEVNFNAPTLNFNGESRVDNLTVRGNLSVLGDTVSVDAEQVRVKDNIIEINKGEPGSGVTAGTAGLRVDRGDAPSYNILFDEADDLFKVGMDNQLETIASREWVKKNSTNYVHPATHPASMITGLAPVATSGNYNDLTNKPTSFPPASHDHANFYVKSTGGNISGNLNFDNNEIRAGGAEKNVLVLSGTNQVIIRPVKNDVSKQLAITPNELIFNNTNKVYHQGFKPSASDIGALPTTGGVATGTIVSSSNDLWKRAIESNNGESHRAVMAASVVSGDYLFGGRMNNFKDDLVQNYIRVGSNKLQYYTNGVTNHIYHSGNKPSASDIGASPTNHDHNGLYYTKSENNNMFFKRRGAIAGDTNWNTVREAGVYKVQMGSWVSGKNAPEMGLYSYGLLEVIISGVESEGRVIQVYHPHRENQPRAFRMCNSEGWQPWQKWHVEASADERYQPKESTKFTMQSANGYVAVRTEGRKAGNYYEFWDNGPGWADIKAGELYANGNRVYHAGNKPTASDIGASPSNHNHASLTGVRSIQFAADTSDTSVLETTIVDTKTYTDMRMADDTGDGWRWRFKHWENTNTIDLMRLVSSSSTEGKLEVQGDIFSKGNKVYHTGNKPTASDIGAALVSHNHNELYIKVKPLRLENRDLNSVITPGDYVVTPSCPNKPTSEGYGRMSVLGWDNSGRWITQVYYSDSKNDVYVRRSTNAEATLWDPWAKMYSEASKPTPAEIGAAKGWLSNGATLHNQPIAVFNDNQSSCVGILKILLPKSWTNTMLSFDLINYDYSGSGRTVFHIGGYNYSGEGGKWVNVQYSVVGTPKSKTVRFGYDDATGKCCILIGDTNTNWSYPKFAINNLLTGHNSWDNWETGWSMSIIKSESGLSKIVYGNNTDINRVTTVGDDTITIKPERSNEVNFGGNFKDNPYMFFGYRDTDGRPAPSVFVFGKDLNGTADVRAKEFYASGNKVYHTGNKPTASDIGALPRSGGTLNGRLNLPNGQDNGLKIGETKFDTVSPKDLAIRNVYQIRFGDTDNWNWNEWAGIRYSNSDKTLYIGGPAGDAFNSNANPPTISLNLKSGVDRVDTPSLVAGGDLRVVKERNYNASLSPNNTSQIGIQSNNNGMGIGLDGTFNSRTGWIQVGHADNAYATSFGDLLLNPKGGTVQIGDAIRLSGRDININGKRALVGFNNADGNKLHVNYNGDFGNGVELRAPLEVLGGGGLTKFKALSGDHMYLEFYPNSANLSERNAWIGYGSAGDRQFTITAERGGKVKIVPGLHANDESFFSNTNGWFTDPWPNQGCAIKGHGNIACNDRVKAWNGFVNGTYAVNANVFMALPEGTVMRNSATMIESDDIIENVKGIQVYQHTQNTIGKEGQSVPTTVAYAIDANTLPIQVVDYNGDGDENKINHSSLEAMLAESCKFSINKIEELAAGFKVLAERLMDAEEKIKVLEGKLNGNTSK